MELANNKKARFNYEIIEKYEAGIELQGTEVKSCRKKSISIGEAFIAFEGGEAWMRECHISTYEQGNRNNHEPKRKRRLLLHKREIKKLMREVDHKGLSVIPLGVHLKRGKIKVSIALCRGKNTVDKRQTMKNRDNDRTLQRFKNKTL
ncbi:SsrA-binding protein SmpB [Lentisphaera profundi]|uniref:SsrA-binding protein n=1 Tax=Lentisphaera profundi TaxID=1658616 RepID=A0ABY7VY94_9BACT|nr:SsrA-binding protein SmpB [Lentisphaera profundi]WDE97842.1 SsrA-binding protein SmpB [Lentisphaera profundi]